MELSTIAAWFSIITSLALCVSGLLRSRCWLRSEMEKARVLIELGDKLVSELLDKATNPVRRADIYAYILFRSTEIEAYHTLQVIRSYTMGTWVALLGFVLAVTFRIFDTDAYPWVWWIMLIIYVVLIAAFLLALFFDFQLRRINSSWQEKVSRVLANRAFCHVSSVKI